MAATKKEIFEYVEIDDANHILKLTNSSITDFQKSIEIAKGKIVLLDQRREHILAARDIATSIKKEMKKLDHMMHHPTFQTEINASKRKKYTYVPKKAIHKKRISKEEEEFLKKSKRAMGGLKANLEFLKHQLK